MIWIISLVIALVLTLPTFGLSLLVWIASFFLLSKAKQRANEARHKKREILNGYISDPGVFMRDLHFPRWKPMSKENANRCGSLILNYIAHNPSEMQIFIDGIHQATTSGMLLSVRRNDGHKATAIEMADGNLDKKIHLVCFRAVEALVHNNNFDYFSEINTKIMKNYINEIEATGKFEIEKEFSIF